MSPQEIRYLLDVNKVSQTSIAQALNVQPGFVGRVINRKRTSLNVAAEVSRAINKKLETVFPEYQERIAA